MTEAEFMDQVVEVAHLYHWRVAHFRPAQTQHGWRTPVGYDGKGWPDLVLTRPGRCLAIEVKSAKGGLTVEQGDWLVRLEEAGVETHVWRSTMALEDVVAVLA